MFELQRLLLKDSVRNDAFTRALTKAIQRGKTTIADIGAGTGFLSFIAERSGAKKCTLYEQSPDLLQLSRTLAKENGIKRCAFIGAHSTEIPQPEKVDLVVSETLGNFAYEENIIEIMNDAKRFLKPGGKMIPQSITQHVCPVTDSRLYEEVDLRKVHDFNFSAASIPCINNMYVKDILPADLMGKGKDVKKWDEVSLTQKNSSIRKGECNWRMNTVTTVYGLALWWDSLLWEGIHLSTSPLSPATHWKQIFLPLLTPVKLNKGEALKVQIVSDTNWEVKINVTWDILVLDSAGKTRERQKMDMRKGYIV